MTPANPRDPIQDYIEEDAMKQGRANGYVCLRCARWFPEMEDAEVCEQSHAQPERDRDRCEDDGLTYGHPGDVLKGLED